MSEEKEFSEEIIQRVINQMTLECTMHDFWIALISEGFKAGQKEGWQKALDAIKIFCGPKPPLPVVEGRRKVIFKGQRRAER